MEIKKRFISFIDILGFKDIIAKNNLEEIGKIMEIIPYSLEQISKSTVLETSYPKSPIKSSVFSDTIVLFSDNDDKSSLDKLLISTSFLFRNSLYKNIILKGTISYGEVAIDPINNLFYGQPIIDSYLLEQEVAYIGVVLHSSVEKYISENNCNDLLNTGKIIELITPLKCGNVEHLNLNWLKMTHDYPSNKDKIRMKIKEIRITCSGAPRKYYDNTLQILDKFYPL